MTPEQSTTEEPLESNEEAYEASDREARSGTGRLVFRLVLTVVQLAVMIATWIQLSEAHKTVRLQSETIRYQASVITELSDSNQRLRETQRAYVGALGESYTLIDRLSTAKRELADKLQQSHNREWKANQRAIALSALLINTATPRTEGLHFTPHDAKPHDHDSVAALPLAKSKTAIQPKAPMITNGNLDAADVVCAESGGYCGPLKTFTSAPSRPVK